MLTFDQLKPGSYYVPVFERTEPIDDLGEFLNNYNTDSPIYQYLGDGQFATEDGDPIDRFYDPELGLDVALNAPDGFVQ